MPDCALIVSAHAENFESMGESDRAIQCYEDFVERFPCSIGFILLQKLIRRTKGIDAARKVFTRANQCLVTHNMEIKTNVSENAPQSATTQDNENATDDTEKIVSNSTKQSNTSQSNGSKLVSSLYSCRQAHI